jgi:carbon monoxide dehydrogenase subunit G
MHRQGENVATYQGTRVVGADADVLFAFLGRVDNLPRYFPRITAAERTGDETIDVTAVIDTPGEDERTVRSQAWFRVDEERHQIEWGSEGPNDYQGDLEVTGTSEESRVSLTLHTEADHPGIQESLEETLDAVARLVEGRRT